MISVKLLTTQKEFNNWVLNELAKQLNNSFPKLSKNITNKIRVLLKTTITSTDAWDSLESGLLKSEFGLNDSKSRLKEILEIWINNIEVVITPVVVKNNNLLGNFTVRAIRSDFSDVLSSEAATLVSRGGNVPWLRWLLLEGDKIILRNYEISYDLNSRESARSRTHKALMFKISNNHEGGQGPYQVPSEYSGTITNNFVTQAFDNIDSKIGTLFIKTLKEVI